MRFAPAGFVAAGALLLNACGGGGTTAPPPPPPPPPPSVATVSVSALPAAMLAGDASQLTATTRDAQNSVLTGRTVVWSSSSDATATVDQTGMVSALGYGPVTITATSETKTGTAQTVVALTLQARRFAFASVSSNAGATAAPGFSRNETSAAVTATHPAVGDYTVTFERLARADPAWRETVMLSKSSENPSGTPGAIGATRCNLNSFGAAANGRDFTVSASCYNGAGAKTNGDFELLVFGNGVIDGRNSFLEVTDAAHTHTPPAAKIFNSAGNPMSVTYQGTGSYTVQVDNPKAAVAENYFSTTIGGPNETCGILGWALGTLAIYRCYTPPAGALADGLYLMQMIGGGRTGKRWAVVWASDPFVGNGIDYTPSLVYQAMSSGGPITIRRNDVLGNPAGAYMVTLPGFGPLTRVNFALQVNAYSSPTATCSAAYAGSTGADMVLLVSCYNRYTGAALDSFFTLAIIE